MIALLLQWLLIATGLFFVLATVLSQVSHSHWFVRGCDFPRLQALTLLVLIALAYGVFYTSAWYDWLFVIALVAAAAWQCRMIFPYTPLAPRQVLPSHDTLDDPRSLTVVISNVQMENRQFDRWLNVVRDADPDLILAVEVDQTWMEHLEPLCRDYPHHITYPQDNHYGIALYSRLSLVDPEISFLVQNDTPSIHTDFRLRSGEIVRFHGVHPRPPEPVRDQNATPRDAELVVIGRRVSQHGDVPTLVAGDLNDVAWSRTTTLFQHISRLLDPRVGRGMFNTFHARYPFFRFPLDHIFHSDHFTLLDLRCLPHVGSDHFPVRIALHYAPRREDEQPEPPKTKDDRQEAHEKIREQIEAEATGEEKGHLHERL